MSHLCKGCLGPFLGEHWHFNGQHCVELGENQDMVGLAISKCGDLAMVAGLFCQLNPSGEGTAPCHTFGMVVFVLFLVNIGILLGITVWHWVKSGNGKPCY